MRGNLRTWCVLGALASAAWVFPGCKSDSRDLDPQSGLDRSQDTSMQTSTQEGTGGSGTVIMERSDVALSEPGTGGSGSMRKDGGTSMDAGTGGSGFDPAAVPNAVPPNMH